MIKVTKVIVRRDIHAERDGRLVVLYQTALNDGSFRNNGILAGDNQYGRPNAQGVWPDWMPDDVLEWARTQLEDRDG